MGSFDQIPDFCYSHGSDTMAAEGEVYGWLDIHVHHARNIHNICIYNNQDVYAKFSLTCNPDDTLSTSIIYGGGKNPEFNETLRLRITQTDAVVKCEIWMLSRARNFLEDQLLGFTLIPLRTVAGKGKLTHDFTLSSTDLFHSPAGTVRLTLLFAPSSLALDKLCEDSRSSISSEVVLLDPQGSEAFDPLAQYQRIEFPDIKVVTENCKMVTEYFNMKVRNTDSRAETEVTTSFLRLCAKGPVSVIDTAPTSGLSASTTTSLSDERSSFDSSEKKDPESSHFSNSPSEPPHHTLDASPGTPTSNTASSSKEEKFANRPPAVEEPAEKSTLRPLELDAVRTSPLDSIKLEAEQKAMQKQIVDMYMKSMQQFTESLARMKFPVDLNKPKSEDDEQVIQAEDTQLRANRKKDGSRVFYGSRAFF